MEQALEYIFTENNLQPKERSFTEDLVAGTCKNTKEIDAVLAKFAEGWTVERMGSTDRNILRLALYELVYRDDVPVGVTVNEAVELAKHYGDDDSGRFVNGILGNIIRRFTLPEKPEAQEEAGEDELKDS